MPSVNLSPETYEKLASYARQSGRTPDSAAELLLDQQLLGRTGDDAWREEFRRARAAVQAELPDALSEEDLTEEIALAVDEIRADVRAGRR